RPFLQCTEGLQHTSTGNPWRPAFAQAEQDAHLEAAGLPPAACFTLPALMTMMRGFIAPFAAASVGPVGDRGGASRAPGLIFRRLGGFPFRARPGGCYCAWHAQHSRPSVTCAVP